MRRRRMPENAKDTEGLSFSQAEADKLPPLERMHLERWIQALPEEGLGEIIALVRMWGRFKRENNVLGQILEEHIELMGGRKHWAKLLAAAEAGYDA